MSDKSGKWLVEKIAGHPCDIYLPAELNSHGYVLLYLHGVHLGKLHDKESFIERFEHHGLPVVAPVTQRSWWTDKICAEFDANISAEQHVLENVLPFIERRLGAKPPRIGLFGTSMGGQGALRLAYKHPNTFPIVAAISPAIDFQNRFRLGDETIPLMYVDEEAARQDSATLHVHPLNWPRHQFFCCDPQDEGWFESSDRLRMKLNSIGIPCECDLETTGGGHGFAYYGRMAAKVVDFLADKLERERLRIV